MQYGLISRFVSKLPRNIPNHKYSTLFISLDNIIYFEIFNFISEREIVREKSAKHSNDQHRKSENFDASSLNPEFSEPRLLWLLRFESYLNYQWNFGPGGAWESCHLQSSQFLTPRFVSAVEAPLFHHRVYQVFFLDKKAMGIDPFRARSVWIFPTTRFQAATTTL